jgi:hypothetical protein
LKDPTIGFRSRRARVPLVVLSATAVVLGALVIGGVLAQRRSAVAEPQATPALISSSPAATVPASSPTPASVPGDPSPTQPPLNGLEVKVIDALDRLGIMGQRAQLPFRDASIWADMGTGSQLFVNAYPVGTVDRNYTVTDERRLAGIQVQHVRRPSYPDGMTSSRFECAGDEYWVRGAVPPGFTDPDAFVERFISALACSR